MSGHTGMGERTAVHYDDVANRMNRFLENGGGRGGNLRGAGGGFNDPARSNRVAAASRSRSAASGGGNGAGEFARRFIRNLLR